MMSYRAQYRETKEKKVSAEAVRAFVLCVPRREKEDAMFSDTRRHLVDRGFPVTAVRRLKGRDVHVGGESLQPNKCVMWAF